MEANPADFSNIPFGIDVSQLPMSAERILEAVDRREANASDGRPR